MKNLALHLGILFLSLVSFQQLLLASAAECGKGTGGALCPKGLCCSQYSWCGKTDEYCGAGCQSQCDGGKGGGPGSKKDTPDGGGDGCQGGGDDGDGDGGISNLISSSMFDEMFEHKDDDGCPGKGFYTYDAFIEAAKTFPAFGTTGDKTTRKREIAAFLAQISHQTTGNWWPRFRRWPICLGSLLLGRRKIQPQVTATWNKCAHGKRYYGRGPMQLSWNYNYGLCGEALGVDLLKNPDLLIKDPLTSFKSAIWFWTSSLSSGTTCHEAITGKGSSATRGFGMVTKVINGALECGKGSNEKVRDRIGYYKRYCDMLGISYGKNIDC